MVPASSIKVSRVSMYSGFRHVNSPFVYGAFTLCGWLSQNHSTRIIESIMRSEPRCARTSVCPLSISLAATLEIDFSFSSSPYLDVSVQAVPLLTLCIGVRMIRVFRIGFPHSDICGSMEKRNSLQQKNLTFLHFWLRIQTMYLRRKNFSVRYGIWSR